MVYDIVERLQETNNDLILTRLSGAVKPSDKKRGKLHEVFEDSFDNKECFTKKFILQKLDYIHWNPVKHGLATHPRNWPYSSFHRFVKLGIYPPDGSGYLGCVEDEGYGE